jgi:hypothetical protein
MVMLFRIGMDSPPYLINALLRRGLHGAVLRQVPHRAGELGDPDPRIIDPDLQKYHQQNQKVR